ncbi:unnamed protein product, partial [Polarella glacialis]
LGVAVMPAVMPEQIWWMGVNISHVQLKNDAITPLPRRMPKWGATQQFFKSPPLALPGGWVIFCIATLRFGLICCCFSSCLSCCCCCCWWWCCCCCLLV